MGKGGRMPVTGGEHKKADQNDIFRRVPHEKPPFTLADVKKAIPPHCFNRSLIRSFSFLVYDLIVCFLLYYVATNYIHLLPKPLSYLAWTAYVYVQGCFMFAVWVVAHECGHHGFSDYHWLNDTVGFILHSLLLVPYFSWKISHRRHHANTNSLDRDENHVPRFKETIRSYYHHFNNPLGRIFIITFTLTLGWPLYLIVNIAGRSYDRVASHFDPYSPIYSDAALPRAKNSYHLTFKYSTPKYIISQMMVFTMILKLLLWVLLLFRCTNSSSHPNSSNGLPVTSSEEAYGQWVKHMGSFNHSLLFQKAKNKFKPCLKLKVHKNPRKGDFTKVQRAINSIPIFSHCRVVIKISQGVYREKVEIPATMSYITLKGGGADKTIIEWNDTADGKGNNGKPLGTYCSATFAVNSPYFLAKNITFKNTAPPPPSGALGKQAVALRISADTASFIGCKFIGAQDTLYDHTGRHYFRDCYIEGSVDFIFGNGLSLYDSCHLHAVTNSYGALTAQKRDSLLQVTGFSFVNCKVTGSGALYLGRAWGSFSTVVFAYTYMDKIITPRGWYNWGDKNREMTVFYGQFQCSGPGADFGGRVTWSRELTQQEAKPFISIDFIDGYDWLKYS